MKYFIFLGVIFFNSNCFSQSVGIGTHTPNVNSILEVSDSLRGVILPRLDSSKRTAIPNTMGMVLFDTSNKNFWFNNGNNWVNLPPKGNANGDLLFWNNNQWNVLPAGTSGQYLSVTPGTLLPVWADVNIGLGNITTKVASNIQPASAVSGGTILTDGGAPVTARGVVWSTSPNPTVDLSTKTNDGTGVGSFISNLSGLSSATTYYLRAYATNANGTSYGNQVSFITYSNFYIGQSYGGGKIFYINATGQHGLIVSPNDLILSITWNNTGSTSSGITTGANGFAIGTGASNTSTLLLPGIYGPNQSYAASLCRLFYSGGGYTDWSLPSLYELQELYTVKSIIGGIGNNKYWSSSEFSFSHAWIIDFASGVVNQSSYNKGNFAAVRAVRSF